MKPFCVRALFLASCSMAVVTCSRSPSGESRPAPATVQTAPPTGGAEAPPASAVDHLLSRIWRVSVASYGPASGSIYIFLPNGTLLETSCVETYRIATWSVDNKDRALVRVVEDQQPAFTATVTEFSGNTLHLRQQLVRSKETRELVLTAMDQEFVCPDLRK